LSTQSKLKLACVAGALDGPQKQGGWRKGPHAFVTPTIVVSIWKSTLLYIY